MFAKKEKYHHLKGDRELILHTKQQTSAFIIIYIERDITNTHTHVYIYSLYIRTFIIMGVPAFFRWLTIKYPEILNKFLEDKFTTVDGQQIPFDATRIPKEQS